MTARGCRSTRSSTRTPLLATIAVLACLAGPLHAQASRFSGEVALASQLVDRGLAISPSTPILQGAISWMPADGWSIGIAGGAELRSPGEPVVVLARVSRSWVLSGDWSAQASLLHYDYRARHGRGIPDRAEAALHFSYRDSLTLGLSAIRASGSVDQRMLVAADVDASWPLTRHVSLTAGAGVAEAAVRTHDPGGHGYYRNGYHTMLYGYGSLGLAWSNGRWRLQLDRNMNSLGARRAYGTRTPSQWVATVSRSF